MGEWGRARVWQGSGGSCLDACQGKSAWQGPGRLMFHTSHASHGRQQQGCVGGRCNGKTGRMATVLSTVSKLESNVLAGIRDFLFSSARQHGASRICVAQELHADPLVM